MVDSSAAELEIQKAGTARLKEKLAGMYNPSTEARATMYMSWLDKQVRQRQKTLELDGAVHSRAMKDILREQKKLLVAKTDSLNSAKKSEDLFEEAIAAMRTYGGADD